MVCRTHLKTHRRGKRSCCFTKSLKPTDTRHRRLEPTPHMKWSSAVGLGGVRCGGFASNKLCGVLIALRCARGMFTPGARCPGSVQRGGGAVRCCCSAVRGLWVSLLPRRLPLSGYRGIRGTGQAMITQRLARATPRRSRPEPTPLRSAPSRPQLDRTAGSPMSPRSRKRWPFWRG